MFMQPLLLVKLREMQACRECPEIRLSGQAYVPHYPQQVRATTMLAILTAISLVTGKEAVLHIPLSLYPGARAGLAGARNKVRVQPSPPPD